MKHNIYAHATALLLAAIAFHLSAGNVRAQNATTTFSTAVRATLSSSRNTDSKAEAQAALSIISGGSTNRSAQDLAGTIRRTIPRFPADQKILLPQNVISNLVRSGKEYEKLVKELNPLLAYCDVVNRIIPILYKSELPVVALMPDGNALVVSTRALDTLDPAEMEALAAHEISHSLVLDEHVRAIDSHDAHALRVIELFCDAGATVLVTSLGRDPGKLISGLSKLQQILEVEYSESERKDIHPTIKTRDWLVKELARQLDLVAAR